MNADLLPLWPRARMPEALLALAQAERPLQGAPRGLPEAADESERSAVLQALAAGERLALDPLSAQPGERPDKALARQCPALVDFAGERVAAVLRVRRRRALLIGPDGRRRSLATVALVSALRDAAPACASLDVLLQPLEGARRQAWRAGWAQARAPHLRLQGLRLTPAADGPFAAQWRRERLTSALLAFGALHLASAAALVAAWWLLGAGALSGRVDHGWLTAWTLLLLTLLALRSRAMWLQGVIALRGGALFKRRVLAGVQRQNVDEVRQRGTGELLGRVLEAGTLEELALGGGLATLLSVVELAAAWLVLGEGAQGGTMHALLSAVLALALAGAAAHVARRRAWVQARVALVDATVDGLLGLRTRLVQQDPARLHEEEDGLLAQDYARGRALDRQLPALLAAPPRLLLLLGLVPLGLAAGGGAPLASVAVGLGGLLLGERALGALLGGLVDLVGAWIAWRQAAPLLAPAAPAPDLGLALEACRARARGLDRGALLEVERLAFARVPGRPLLEDCSLSLAPREALLVVGASGAGKSTLAALLAGLLPAQGGTLRLHGLPLTAWGAAAWRRALALCPQFHENHVFAAPLAFNLLCGRRWPPHDHDLHEAEAVCQELGLGTLLRQMPAGLMQPVGEGGWQLSHGERARVCLGRALLQGADVLVLDETLAALDADTLRASLETTLRRSGALVLVAHP